MNDSARRHGRDSIGRHPFEFPLSLGDWIERPVLFHWLIEEIQSLDWDHPDLVAYLEQHPNYSPRELLCLTLWAYSTGIFESSEVCRLAWKDPLLAALAPKMFETQQVVEFRRRNRGLLKWGLNQILRRVVREKYGIELLPAGLRNHLAEEASNRLDLARHMDRTEQEW